MIAFVEQVLVLLLLFGSYHLAQGASRSYNTKLNAVVLTYVEPPEGEDVEPLWDAVRVMVHWLVQDPARCVCTDVVVLTSHGIHKDHKYQLENDGAIVVEVSNPGFKINGYEKRWSSTWAKLLTMNLTWYERVILMDSDMVLLDRVDSLFEWADEYLTTSCSIGGVANVEFNPEDKSGFNSGVLLIQPDSKDFEGLVHLGKTKTVPGDQDLFNDFFRQPGKRWCKIPIRYHRFPSYRWPTRKDNTTADDVVAHGAAWRGNLSPVLKEVWELGLQAVKNEDKLRALFGQMGKMIPVRRSCAHCLVSKAKQVAMARARAGLRGRLSD